MKFILEAKNTSGKVKQMDSKNPQLMEKYKKPLVWLQAIDSSRLPLTPLPIKLQPRIPRTMQTTEQVAILTKATDFIRQLVCTLIPLYIGKKLAKQASAQMMLGIVAMALTQFQGNIVIPPLGVSMMVELFEAIPQWVKKESVKTSKPITPATAIFLSLSMRFTQIKGIYKSTIAKAIKAQLVQNSSNIELSGNRSLSIFRIVFLNIIISAMPKFIQQIHTPILASMRKIEGKALENRLCST